MATLHRIIAILKRMVGYNPSPSLDLPSSHIDWEVFVKSSVMLDILYADNPRDLPSSPQIWDDLCQEACSLWNSLMKDGLIDRIPMCYPTLCMLIKGRYYYQRLKEKAAERIFAENASTNLVRSLATCPYCPLSFAERVLNNHKNQLWIADYETNQTPLHLLCIQEKRSSNGMVDSLIPLFVRLCNSSASVIDKEGRYPLHCACQSRYTWRTGIHELVFAAPSIVTSVYNNQVPFILLALALAGMNDKANQEKLADEPFVLVSETQELKDTQDIETLFEVLRCYPSIVQSWRKC
jgi:hypothetical protein